MRGDRDGDIAGIVEDMTAMDDDALPCLGWRSLNAQAPRQCPRCGTVYGVSIVDVMTDNSRCPWCGRPGGQVVGGGQG